ncbi:MAG: phenylalanine--tRNA ligase subunit beta [Chitinophagaceae bacterium]
MTISYKWLCDYLPASIIDSVDPERLSKILTSIGLEVESLEKFEEIKGGLKGLVIGEVLEAIQHPNADKLKLTKVNVGSDAPLKIVCGAPNVAVGQKVIVATVGTTIYPVTGDPLTMKLAKIRGEESQGMICAEDEIGLGASHAGIMVLPSELKPGTSAADYFKLYEDWVYEIGLTPNRMDAMSHWGVARDVCAYLSYHDKKEVRPTLPTSNTFKADNTLLPIVVTVENTAACPRYSGVSIAGVAIKESPRWLQEKLKSIGLRSINNIVDITNFIQHETGQPLHAFDADHVRGKKVIVKNLPEGTSFITLDEKERKLSTEDLMICDSEGGICIAGVFGGLHSGVSSSTKNIFLESACFDAVTIRKTSFRHNLRTDAASRFEKGTDISATVNVLKRAALMIKEIAGGSIASDIIDVYPEPRKKTEVTLPYSYLKKLSGKDYQADAVKNILTSLGFEVLKDGTDEITVAAPFHKPDINLPADIVEEILRIDGLDNVAIPTAITISPSVEKNYLAESYKEKVAGYLVGQGFNEIMTNSITNSAYFSEEELSMTVKMLNSLSAELNVMRPSMLETGLESIAHNLNRKNNNLRFFEFGRTYKTSGSGAYSETEHLCLYLTGDTHEDGWRSKGQKADFYLLKGIAAGILQLLNIGINDFRSLVHQKFETGLEAILDSKSVLQLGIVNKKVLSTFSIKQPVVFAVFNWQALAGKAEKNKSIFKEIPKFPSVQRDLALVVPSQLPYETIEAAVENIRLGKLRDMRLFDIFESEKLGTGKKSLAISFTFSDNEKTLTDKEIDGWMGKIINVFEKELHADIRK